VEIGVAALVELTPAALLSAVGVKEIARRAGVGAPALYHHFGTLEAYAEAVVARVYDPERFAVHRVTDGVDDMGRDSLPLAAVRRFHERDFDRLLTDPLFRVRLGLWALGGSTVDQPYGDLLRTIDRRIGASAASLFEAWGRELRPPVDVATYVAAHTALVSGSVVRHLVDPAAMDARRFSGISTALALPLLRARDDTRTLDDRLTELNYFPRRGDPRTRSGFSAAEESTTMARLLDGAAQVFGLHGFRGASAAQVARQAGVSVSTLYNHVEGLADLAVALLFRQFLDAAPTLDRTTDTAAALLQMAEFCAHRLDWIEPYVVRLALQQPGTDPLVDHVRSAGIEPTDPESTQSLVLLTLSRLLRTPSAGPGGAVDHARGLLAPQETTEEPA
jgi:AcrR family transcriptional regulator